MTKVKVTVGLAGVGFAYKHGEIVDRDIFAGHVGVESYKNVSVPHEDADHPTKPTPKPKKDAK